ncbi:MAG TPA: phosphatidate cytidylyltransferase [Thermoanaerobaculia bacterium]|nr:phosphatidate cytidylyltransferase [Thermoanaerobaculia bacterium]
MKRLLTAAVGVPLVLAALFWLPEWWFFLFIGIFFVWAAFEYVTIVRPRAASAPLSLLLGLVPLLAAALTFLLSPRHGVISPVELAALVLLPTVGLGTLVLFARVSLEETLQGLGILGFGAPYFALPLASLVLLKDRDPWLVFLLMAIVWLGDTAAYYVGSRLGRHRLAPTISPKKSWEGAAAGFLTSVLSAAVWSVWRLGGLQIEVLAVAAVTAVAAQVGDLVESMIKRGSGVKDSGTVLPGHGGFLDRIDALLFAAPVMLFGVLLGAVP